MSHTYSHSDAFAKLKNLKESIQSNLTSFQYLSVLDELLYRAIDPLIGNTRFVDVFMAQMLGWQTLNPKRKTSGLGRQALGASITLFLLSDSPKQKLKLLKRMRLDRAMLFEVLRRWFDTASRYKELSETIASQDDDSAYLTLLQLQHSCCIKPGCGFTSTYKTSEYWFNQALKFKEKILEKYTRLCLMTAKRDYEELSHQVPLDDILQIYLMTAGKAIDKCDSERGVLTTHIQNWLLSAKNVVVTNYLSGGGSEATKVAFSTTTNKKIVDDMLESSDIEVEDLSHSDDDAREKADEVAEIRRIAKACDPAGYGRIALGIHEVLSKDDIAILKSLAV